MRETQVTHCTYLVHLHLISMDTDIQGNQGWVGQLLRNIYTILYRPYWDAGWPIERQDGGKAAQLGAQLHR